MERSEVYELIEGERDYQENMPQERRYRQSRIDFLLAIRYYVDNALTLAGKHPGDDVIVAPELRKIAALAVAAMEKHGAPPRDIETSAGPSEVREQWPAS